MRNPLQQKNYSPGHASKNMTFINPGAIFRMPRPVGYFCLQLKYLAVVGFND